MATFAYIVGQSDVQLWSLDSHQRISRQLKQIGNVNLVDDPSNAQNDAQVLLLRADYLFEVRTLRELLNHGNSAILHAADSRPAAANVDAASTGPVLAAMIQGVDLPAAVDTMSPEDLGMFDHQLRKAKPPLLEPLDRSNRKNLEALLYGGAYKGITDLVTKFWLPRPARFGVRICARFGIAPNTITAVGFVLMLLACYLPTVNLHWDWSLVGS